ncbi:MAG TPA: hypothetical protein VGH49_18700 [Xanthobacteraceae bacterium]|jgi:hypothetical protein
MPERTLFVESITRQIIEECRRDIEAAALHIAAARAILKGSQWLLARWEERRRADAVTGGIRLPVYDEERAGGFVTIEPAGPRRRGRKRRIRTGAAADRHNRRQSASE